MGVAESMEEPDAHPPRGTEPAVSVEPAGVQGLPVERKPGEAVGLSLRRGHAQLPAEVDGSTEVATADSVRGTGPDAAEAPRRHCQLLPDQGPLWSRGGRERKHPYVDQPRPRLQKPTLSIAESQAPGRDERRIHRCAPCEKSRVKWHVLTNSCGERNIRQFVSERLGDIRR